MLSNKQNNALVAAVDLGSNSFHMIVVKVVDGQIQVVDKLKEMVRLASGFDSRRMLTGEVWETALTCLERFGQRLREMPRSSVRIVGTNTLRSARNANQFIAAAEVALGHQIHVISGVEEARLIYLGVSFSMASSASKSLVIDIGGGSTELIIGKATEPLHLHSLYMGCVSMSKRFFGNGKITEDGFIKAEIATRLELQSIQAKYKKIGWVNVIGASGTIKAVRSVMQEMNWCDTGITWGALQALKKHLIELKECKAIYFNSLNEKRTPVFTGGVAVLIGLFEGLSLSSMQVSEGALREGLIYDLIGRNTEEDVRSKTVYALMQRYQVDIEQVKRVQTTALDFYRQVAEKWEIENPYHHQILVWASQLHEIGLAIAHSQYYRHAAYLLENSDMPGFSKQDQRKLANVVCLHRRKLRWLGSRLLQTEDNTEMLKIIVIFRLAILFHRSRSESALPKIKLKVKKKLIQMQMDKEWLFDHPLTKEDIDQEREYLKDIKYKLEIIE